MTDQAWLLAQQAQMASIVVETIGMAIADMQRTIVNQDNAGCYAESAYAEKARQLDALSYQIMQNR